MKRYELWIDNEDKLVLSEFGSLNSESEKNILRGAETYNLIQLLTAKQALKIKEKYDNLSIQFENYIININEASDVLSKRGTSPLVKIIKKYYEKETLKKTKKKKVTRKNKHTGRKIIATGLIALTLLGTAKVFKDDIVDMKNDFLNSFGGISVSAEEQEVSVENIAIKSKDSFVFSNLNYEEITKVSIDYSDRSDTDKAFKTKAYYGNLIEKYAKRYGMDPNLVLAIAIQERGVHGTTIDKDGAIGLMQIQYNVWVDEKISAYNFETGQRESFIVSGEKLSDIDYNIKVGCMYLQNCMESMDYNTVAAVQAYNMGRTGVKNILKAYSENCGKSVKEILSNPTNTEWLDYRCIIKKGDQNYVEHVFSYLGENSDIKTTKNDGSIVNININNKVSSKKIC